MLKSIAGDDSRKTDNYCTACWSGNYPIPVDLQTSKFGLERHQMNMFEG
jgi:hypothetical protein